MGRYCLGLLISKRLCCLVGGLRFSSYHINHHGIWWFEKYMSAWVHLCVLQAGMSAPEMKMLIEGGNGDDGCQEWGQPRTSVLEIKMAVPHDGLDNPRVCNNISDTRSPRCVCLCVFLYVSILSTWFVCTFQTRCSDCMRTWFLRYQQRCLSVAPTNVRTVCMKLFPLFFSGYSVILYMEVGGFFGRCHEI